ncbi:MAG: antitoxin [Acidimicrobiia bacterium]
MRTTIDLPDDLHRVATSIARDQGTSLSEAVAMLLRRAIGTPGNAEIVTSKRTRLDVIHLGRAITNEDVRALDDEA